MGEWGAFSIATTAGSVDESFIYSRGYGEMSYRAKFIFVSGHAQDVIECEGELDADSEIMMKPIMPFELLERIRLLITGGTEHD